MAERKRKILVVDDEAELRRMLCIFLGVENFDVTECETGTDALRLTEALQPDLVILDLGLSDMDGKQVLSAVRKCSQLPIIVLTARTDDEETALALSLGADDYVTKPFHVEVLLARIHANLRQPMRALAVSDIGNGPIRIDPTRHEVYVNGEHMAFSPKEFDLLWMFISRKGDMLGHKEILRQVWGPAHAADIQYLRVYLRQIRTKLEAAGVPGSLFVAESGVGYRMEHIAEKTDRI